MQELVDLDVLEPWQGQPSFQIPQDVPAGLRGMTKRFCDLALALPIFVFALPLLAVISALILIQGGGPVIYRQERCGQNGKPFICYKFRTMHLDAPTALADYLQANPGAAAEWEKTQKLRHDPRITTIGRILRKTSLDELPQLINIIAGEMSVIGPRPVTFEELERYGANLSYYIAARPGVTGLWQVNGRSTLSYQQRVNFDAQYVKEWSFFKDIKILLKTIPVVLFAKGAF